MATERAVLELNIIVTTCSLGCGWYVYRERGMEMTSGGRRESGTKYISQKGEICPPSLYLYVNQNIPYHNINIADNDNGLCTDGDAR